MTPFGPHQRFPPQFPSDPLTPPPGILSSRLVTMAARSFLVPLAAAVCCLAVLPQLSAAYFSPSMAYASGYTKIASSNRSLLYRIESNATEYDTAPYLAVLQGNRHDIGYDYGQVLEERGGDRRRGSPSKQRHVFSFSLLTFLFFAWAWPSLAL